MSVRRVVALTVLTLLGLCGSGVAKDDVRTVEVTVVDKEQVRVPNATLAVRGEHEFAWRPVKCRDGRCKIDVRGRETIWVIRAADLNNDVLPLAERAAYVHAQPILGGDDVAWSRVELSPSSEPQAIRLKKGWVLEGVVHDQSGSPVAAFVSHDSYFGDSYGRTEDDGTFRITNTPGGSIGLFATRTSPTPDQIFGHPPRKKTVFQKTDERVAVVISPKR